MNQLMKRGAVLARQPGPDAASAPAPRRLLTEREAAFHCGYFERGCTDPVRAFQRVARRAGIPVKYIGRSRLYDARVLDAFLERAAWTRRSRRPRRQEPAS